jgi:palmitoyl-protein thioesterase
MKPISLLALTTAFLASVAQAGNPVPTAIFHGFGDSCWFPGMSHFAYEIGNLTGAYATCIEIGWGSTTSIFENFESQAEEACKKVLADPNFQGEFNVLGLSQGGLLARHIVERCPTKGQPRNLVTLGGPNMGVSASPHCFTGLFCAMINYIIDNLVYFQTI